jgi:metal-responsive CopG/Arc/MetJ family transcriptional regulator
MSKDYKQVSVKLPENLVEKMDDREEKTGMNRTSQIRNAVAKELGVIDQ